MPAPDGFASALQFFGGTEMWDGILMVEIGVDPGVEPGVNLG